MLFEEANTTAPAAHYYVLTVAQPATPAAGADASATMSDWEIARKIWFDRTDLHISEIQIYGPDGKVASDIHYSDWSTTDPIPYPRQISVHRLSGGLHASDRNHKSDHERSSRSQPVRAPAADGIAIGARG